MKIRAKGWVWGAAAGLLFVVAAVAGCSKSGQMPPQGGGRENMSQDHSMVMTSSAFGVNQKIPRQYSGEGRDTSPPLAWSGVPAKARELALIVDDPDAPRAEPWVHWVIYQIAVTVTGLPEAVPTSEVLASPPGSLQGRNTAGKIGYMGPMPPPGHGTPLPFQTLRARCAAGTEVRRGQKGTGRGNGRTYCRPGGNCGHIRTVTDFGFQEQRKRRISNTQYPIMKFGFRFEVYSFLWKDRNGRINLLNSLSGLLTRPT
jgi:Raf kinase inhibitor-like YbhB/YbcL family protein